MKLILKKNDGSARLLHERPDSDQEKGGNAQ